MHHFDYEIKLLAEQRSTELMTQAERSNQLRNARRRQRRKYFRSFLIRSRRPAPGRIAIDLREPLPPPPEPAPSPAKATDAAEEGPEAMHTGLRFSR